MLSERKLQIVLGTVGVGAFSLILFLEAVTEETPITAWELFFEGLELILIIAAVAAMALLVTRMRS